MAITQYSNIKVFRVNCDCERYTPYRFAWLNRLGGFDTYTFRLKSTHTINSSSKEYKRYLSRYQQDGTFGYQLGDRGRKVYDIQSMDVYTVVSTWQTSQEHAWLSELFTSPAVYLIQTLDGVITYDPVIITKNSVEIRTKKGYGNRLLSHTIEFMKAYNQVSQRG